jgi:predicted nucleotidyltransferase
MTPSLDGTRLTRTTPDQKKPQPVPMKNPLAKKNKGRKIYRATATRMLSDFLARVDEVNRNEKFAFFVEEVRFFGSYLRGEAMVGDVDLAFSLCRKTMAKLRTRSLEIARDIRRPHASFNKKLCDLSVNEVTRYLQSRSGWLDFAAIENLEKNGFPNEVIFELPRKKELIEAIQSNEDTTTVKHLHRIVNSPRNATRRCERDR